MRFIEKHRPKVGEIYEAKGGQKLSREVIEVIPSGNPHSDQGAYSVRWRRLSGLPTDGTNATTRYAWCTTWAKWASNAVLVKSAGQ